MARISLRAYNAEIETLIENEKTDEAVAHCRHILTIFPKHVHTYRLLGKAYLENRQHTEALDIFERLLTAVPDDFIAHLGMSIIREEEGNLDAAIWHMERAFELQPYNSAIQDEMRRLYGRRDGAEPVKIRLTRGALARMYARGNLYEQAVAEIRQVLANEPQRPDMQVLLAQMYEKMEKPVQAAEACSRLLKKYPYCLEANRILAHVLENSKRPEEAKTYRERLQALNPYYAYINPQAPTLEDIPDEAVQLEKMKYTSTDILPVQQESGWLTTIGVEETALETIQEEEELPAWLTGEEEPQEAATASDSLAEAPASEEELIPDWMKEAGWGPDSGEFDESAVSLDGADETFAEETEEGAAPAELPDWLQEIAPPEVATGMLTTPGEEQDEGEDQALAALIDTGSLGPLPESKAAPAEELPDWLSEVGEQEAGIGEQAKAAPAEEIPDWLSEVGEQGAGIGEQEEAVPAEEIPDWLSEVGEQAEPPSTAPGLPSETEPPSTVSGPPSEAEAPEDMDAAMAWLESLAAKQGVSEEELLTAPEERPEEAPEWVQEEAVSEQEAGIGEQAEPSSTVHGLPSETEEIPDWLSEASEQGAGIGEQAEPPSTVPGQPSETEPPSTVPGLPSETEPSSTVHGLPSEAEPPSTVPGQPSETEPPSTVHGLPSETEEIPDWLSEVSEQGAGIGEQAEAAPAEEIPDWLSEVGEQAEPPTADHRPPTTEAEPPSTVSGPPSEAEAPEDMDAAMAWLESLAAKQGVSEEELLTAPEERPEEAPEWVQEEAVSEQGAGIGEQEEAAPAEEIPDWLSEASEQGAGIGEQEQAVPAEEIPDWLSEASEQGAGIGEQAEPSSTVHGLPSKTEEIPDWLSEIGEQETGTGEQAEPPSTVSGPPSETEPPSTVSGPPSEPEASEDMDAAMAWLESLAAKQGVSEEELLTAPEERPAEAPEWVQEEAVSEQEAGIGEQEEAIPAEEIPDWLSEASEQGAGTGEQVSGVSGQVSAVSEQAEAAPAEEIPDWLSDIGEQETAVSEQAEPPSTVPGQPSEAEPPSTVSGPPSEAEAPEDMDAAMAWLESLAAKQGVSEEELLTAPEERPEEAPEWVQGEAVSEQGAGVSEQEEAAPAEELPDWLSEAGEQGAGIGEQAEVVPAEEIPGWLSEASEQGAGIGEQAEPPSTVHGQPSEAEPPSTVHGLPSETEEIPDWLSEASEQGAGIGEQAEPPSTVSGPPSEAEAPAEEGAGWVPEESIPKAATAPLPPPPDWVLEGEAPQEEAAPPPVTWDERGQADIEKLELNQASLIQLERLPGIGFRLAQAITTYREAHGPFRTLQDLENVAGIGPMTLAELRNFLYVEAPKTARRRRPPTGMPLPDAETAIQDGEIEEAVHILAPVIHSGGALDEVIHLLQRALRDAPDHLDLWIALGDACMRADRLEDALQAYNRAEEILASGI